MLQQPSGSRLYSILSMNDEIFKWTSFGTRNPHSWHDVSVPRIECRWCSSLCPFLVQWRTYWALPRNACQIALVSKRNPELDFSQDPNQSHGHLVVQIVGPLNGQKILYLKYSFINSKLTVILSRLLWTCICKTENNAWQD